MRQRAPQHGISDYQKCSIPLKAAGQLRTAEVTKAAELIFGDMRAHLCIAKLIRRDCARCEARDFSHRCRRMIGIVARLGPPHDWGRPTIGVIPRSAPSHDRGRHVRAIIMGACGKGCFAQTRLGSSRKRKRPVRTSGPKRELEARRGTGPHTRRGCTVLVLGRCTGTYCFGVAGKLGRGPRVCKAKV